MNVRTPEPTVGRNPHEWQPAVECSKLSCGK